MKRELARIIICLLDDKLNLPSTYLEILEEKLVTGKFDEVYDFYCKRWDELNNIKN